VSYLGSISGDLVAEILILRLVGWENTDAMLSSFADSPMELKGYRESCVSRYSE
jgi:hypothetical protein